MDNLRKKFTKWYFRKGYRMEWKACGYDNGVGEMIFYCPFWVRPLVYYFFSPTIYYAEEGYLFNDGLECMYEDVRGDDHAQSGMENT